jgi:hypothetical protein
LKKQSLIESELIIEYLQKSFCVTLLFEEEEDFSNHQMMTKANNVNYPVKHICITTCGELYQKWKIKKPKLYEKAPKNGITIDVEYADTLNAINNDNESDNSQVVLALHGAPGSHSDFAPIIEHMTDAGVRVIAPNFPGLIFSFV